MVKGAGAVFPLLAGLFWLATPLGLLDAAFLAFLLELLPALALAQLPLIDEDEAIPRVSVYLSSGATILFVGWLAVIVGRRSVGDAAMGLELEPASWAGIFLWTVGLLACALVLMWGFLVLRRVWGLKESRLVEDLLPRTPLEKAVFALLSIAAGLGEELAYRGYLIPVLAGVLGTAWGAALLSSVMFGVLHAYQGWLGVVRTGILGLVFGISLIVSGSLWPAILSHAILDLVVGLVLGDSLVKELD
jgi:membrane protease YdiL (CAAX protease family)